MQDLQSKLKRRRDELVRVASARLTKDPHANITTELDSIAAIEILLKSYPVSLWQRFKAPAFLAIACVVLIGAGWMIRISHLGWRTSVTLNVDAEAVRLRTIQVWKSRVPFRSADGIVGSHGFSLKFSNASLTPDSYAPGGAIELKAAYLGIQELVLEPKTDLTLEWKNGGRLVLYALGGQASGTILVNKYLELKWSQDGVPKKSAHMNLLGPELISISARREVGAPARITFQPEVPLVLHDLAISLLQFGIEVEGVGARSEFVSTISKGHVRVLDINQSYELTAGDAIILEDGHGRIRQLQVDDKLQVNFEGTVRRLLIGPTGYEREFTPTIITYLYYNQQLTFLVAAASFVWGLLWSIRRLVNG